MSLKTNQNSPGYLLAIDLGSSACKASVLSLDGEMISLSRAVTPLVDHDPDEMEETPERWWQAAVGAIQEAILKAAVPPTKIVGIGVCAFMHTPIGLDAHGAVVTPTIIWYDTRSTPQAEALRQEFGSQFREITGDEPRHNHTAAKIRWLVDNYPERVAQVRHWLLPKDYLRYRLTGLISTDVSDAMGTLLYDPVQQRWDEALVKAAGTEIVFLPDIYETLKQESHLSKAGADATGLVEGTPVVGCADGYATLIGANGCSDGQTCLYLGTSAWITRFVFDINADPRHKIVPLEDGYHQWLGAIASAGATLSWIAKIFGAEDIATLLASAETIQPGAEGLLFLPHLAGERGPVHDPYAKGALVGLSLAHNRPEILRAVLEGVAFQITSVLQASELQDEIEILTIVGGGATSCLWVQIIADIINKNLEVPVIVEAGLLGTAALTGTAIGLLRNPQVNAAGMYRRAYVQEPDSDRARRYLEVFRKYEETDTLFNKGLFKSWREENIK
ncbi:MAG: FGGY family carbohydrate kinase [Anaerolineales bacterium]